MTSVATVFDGNLAIDHRSAMLKSSAARAKRGSDGDFLVQDLDSVEDLGNLDVVIPHHHQRTTHHLVIREFPTWIEPPKSAQVENERKQQRNVEAETTQNNHNHNNSAFGNQQNVHYLNQFLNHLGSLPYEKSGKEFQAEFGIVISY